MIKLQQSADLAQIASHFEIKKAERAKASPYVGWAYGARFAVKFLVGPMGGWGSAYAGYPAKFPQIDLRAMAPLLFRVLRLGA